MPETPNNILIHPDLYAKIQGALALLPTAEYGLAPLGSIIVTTTNQVPKNKVVLRLGTKVLQVIEVNLEVE